MYDGKTVLLAIMVKLSGLDTSKPINECIDNLYTSPNLLDNLSLRNVYEKVIELPDEHLAKVLGFLIVNYCKMHPNDTLIYHSFIDGDYQKIYDIIIKSKDFFYDLLNSFIGLFKKGKYPEVTGEAKDRITKIELIYGEANIYFVDTVIINMLSYLFEGIENSNGFSTAAMLLTLGIFFGRNIQATIDISYEINFLKGYAPYVYKILHAEVYAMYSAGLITLNSDFEDRFLIKIHLGEYYLDDITYTTDLMKYFFIAKRTHNIDLSPDIIEDAKAIDPLYHTTR